MGDKYVAKVVIKNGTDRPRIVVVEPWGEDFTLLPGEQLDIVVWDIASQPWFNIYEHADFTAAWVEEQAIEPDQARGHETHSFGYNVWQNGVLLECGHQRQAALDAGVTF